LHNEGVYSSQEVVKVVKSRMMRCVGYVTWSRYEYRTLDDLGPGRKVIVTNGLYCLM